nr:hypothetical protein [Tanacetum cinerariifolium]
ETLFWVKFTSQSDIEVFSMSIKEGKYADILSTMSSADIDAAVNAIETIGKKFQYDVAATFEVPLSTVGDIHKLINDIEAGKHDELLSEMTNDDHMETLDALGSICSSIQANRNNAYVIPCKVLHVDDSINLNVDESTIPSDLIMLDLRVQVQRSNQKLIPTFVPWWLIQFLIVVTSLFLAKLSKRLVLALNTLYMATLLEREWRFR